MEPAVPLGAPPAESRGAHYPCQHPARAWYGDELVAESEKTVRLEEPGRPPSLYFPVSDIRMDRFVDEGRRARCDVKGEARLWSWGGPGPETVDLLWSFDQTRPDFRFLSGLAAFDHDRVRVELVDAAGGDDGRDVTVKRFPTWGDASHMVEMLDVRSIGGDRYRGAFRDSHSRSVVEGSQMLGQTVVAAMRHAPGRRPVSAHMAFCRSAAADRPLEFSLEQLAAGRNFITVQARALQGEMVCGAGTVLLGTVTADVMRHEAEAPSVPGPYDCAPCDMSVMGRDIRVAGGAYTGDPAAPVGPPVIDAWVRFRDLPADPAIHAGLVTQFTGHVSIAAAMRPHAGIGQDQAHYTLSTAINAISISFHSDVRADQWLLYHHLSTFAGGGMTHSECRVHDLDGRLAASFSVEAMVRTFDRPVGGPDRSRL